MYLFRGDLTLPFALILVLKWWNRIREVWKVNSQSGKAANSLLSQFMSCNIKVSMCRPTAILGVLCSNKPLNCFTCKRVFVAPLRVHHHVENSTLKDGFTLFQVCPKTTVMCPNEHRHIFFILVVIIPTIHTYWSLEDLFIMHFPCKFIWSSYEASVVQIKVKNFQS